MMMIMIIIITITILAAMGSPRMKRERRTEAKQAIKERFRLVEG